MQCVPTLSTIVLDIIVGNAKVLGHSVHSGAICKFPIAIIFSNKVQSLQFLAFGLGTMVYIGLEFGSWFEIPWDSPCYQVFADL